MLGTNKFMFVEVLLNIVNINTLIKNNNSKTEEFHTKYAS